MISHFCGVTNECDEDDDDNNIGDLYEDMSESEPAEKYFGPIPSGGEKTLRAVDRQWPALKSGCAQGPPCAVGEDPGFRLE